MCINTLVYEHFLETSVQFIIIVYITSTYILQVRISTHLNTPITHCVSHFRLKIFFQLLNTTENVQNISMAVKVNRTTGVNGRDVITHVTI